MKKPEKTRRKHVETPESVYGPEDYVRGASQRLMDLGQVHEGLTVADAYGDMDPDCLDPLDILLREEEASE